MRSKQHAVAVSTEETPHTRDTVSNSALFIMRSAHSSVPMNCHHFNKDYKSHIKSHKTEKLQK